MAFSLLDAAPYRRAVEKYGGILLVEEGIVTVNTTVTVIVGADPERVNLMIINLSGQAVFVAPFQNPSSSRGILLEANGGALVVDAELDGIFPTASWFGIANLASAAVYRLSQRRTVAVE